MEKYLFSDSESGSKANENAANEAVEHAFRHGRKGNVYFEGYLLMLGWTEHSHASFLIFLGIFDGLYLN